MLAGIPVCPWNRILTWSVGPARTLLSDRDPSAFVDKDKGVAGRTEERPFPRYEQTSYSALEDNATEIVISVKSSSITLLACEPSSLQLPVTKCHFLPACLC